MQNKETITEFIWCERVSQGWGDARYENGTIQLSSGGLNEECLRINWKCSDGRVHQRREHKEKGAKGHGLTLERAGRQEVTLSSPELCTFVPAGLSC